MSTEIDDGGPAFPTPDFHLAHERGMSLAGQATDFRQVARDLRRMARASLDCSP